MAVVFTPLVISERSRIYPAAALALVIEVLLVTGAYRLLSHDDVRPIVPPPTIVTLALAPPPKHDPVQTPPKPEPVHPVQPVVHTHPVEHVTQRHAVAPPHPEPVHSEPVPIPAPPVTEAAVPTEPAHASEPPPPAPPTPPSAAQSASFEGALRAAIQAALHYPESARMAGMSGRTRVAFEYRDGVVSDISVAVTSGIGLLDRAALAAVRDAVYPKPVAPFAGKTISEQVWVTFNLDEHP